MEDMDKVKFLLYGAVFCLMRKTFFFFLVGKALKRVLSVMDHHKFWYNISLHFAMSLGLILFLFSCSVMSDSLWPHGLQHTRLPWPSLSLRFSSNSYPLIQWWEYQSDEELYHCLWTDHFSWGWGWLLFTPAPGNVK